MERFERPSSTPDWQDCHEGPLNPRHLTAREAFEAGFASLPGWVETALKVRDAVVGRLGLKTVTKGEVSMTSLPA